jgi:hypothetical protein
MNLPRNVISPITPCRRPFSATWSWSLISNEEQRPEEPGRATSEQIIQICLVDGRHVPIVTMIFDLILDSVTPDYDSICYLYSMRVIKAQVSEHIIKHQGREHWESTQAKASLRVAGVTVTNHPTHHNDSSPLNGKPISFTFVVHALSIVTSIAL